MIAPIQFAFTLSIHIISDHLDVCSRRPSMYWTVQAQYENNCFSSKPARNQARGNLAD